VQRQRAYVGGGLQPGAALVVVRLAVVTKLVTLPPRSTAPLWLVVVWLAVVSGQRTASTQSRCGGGVAARPRRPGARSGLPCPVSACGRRGRLAVAGSGSITGWILGGVGPDKGLRGERKQGVVCGVGQERLGPSYFFISLVLGPLNSLLWYTFLKVYMKLGSYFVSARTNKRHHHHQRWSVGYSTAR
jgi:hypothetical protein